MTTNCFYFNNNCELDSEEEEEEEKKESARETK